MSEPNFSRVSLPLAPKPDLAILPFKACIRETGQPLTFAQAAFLLLSGSARFVRIERSYPGAPEAIGWAVFERTPKAYIHVPSPLFDTERQARRYLRVRYAIQADLNGDDAATYSDSHL